jgi:macrolide-specific efflux system membrane fusion protein
MTNDQVSEILSGITAGEKVVIPTTTTAQARVPGFGGGAGGFGGGPAGGPVIFSRGG